MHLRHLTKFFDINALRLFEIQKVFLQIRAFSYQKIFS